MSRTATQCDQCGSVDTHPKAHWLSGESYHHDCIPFKLRREIIENSEHGQSVVEAAESGVRGDDLLAHIQALHQGE